MQSPANAATAAENPNKPTFQSEVTFEQLGKTKDLALQGINATDQIDFTLRRDHIATNVALNLIYTPSPALLPELSHLRVFLNDALMTVLPITPDQLGRQVIQHIDLDAHQIVDFNHIRINFIGHYDKVNENPVNSSLWLNISRKSSLDFEQQALAVKNDLSYFPAPFFDSSTREALVLPFVFTDNPTPEVQRAAAILASYFGSRADWRGARFPVVFDQPPRRHAIVFATNDKRPTFLADYPSVPGPVIKMINNPENPYLKMLLVLGRNDKDLAQAAIALALGNPMFRGDSVTVNDVQVLKPRLPYDAPNWIRTDRPVQFAELIDYPEQLQAPGLLPAPIQLNLSLPPDLFIWRNTGIPMELKYRHTPQPVNHESRLIIALNSKFIASFPLNNADQQSQLDKLHLPLRSDSLFDTDRSLSIPALSPSIRNVIRFDFSYTGSGGTPLGQVGTSLLPDTRAAIDDDSTLDFSGFRHYIALPNLQVFANTGFPFSRMADLSETIVIMPKKATPASVGTMLDLMGNIGADTGYPGLGVIVVTDWETAAKADADLLTIGPMPEQLRHLPNNNLMLDTIHGWFKQARAANASAATTQISLTSTAPIAAIVGSESPLHKQRSVVSLLASTPEDYALLRTALGDPGKRAAMSGSVVIVRESGVYSQQIGPMYNVGFLPWWTQIWYRLYAHPVLLAITSGLTAVLIAFLLWYAMHKIAHRRLAEDTEQES
ncbi:cellulose biosynthesis cyclic di-GMP-binding regulatory protein BcsB [Alcaligenaceae bacterium CGII-47]|nr:cellulose biosynthesis cyclic di-GMP-binding regulatory protein BcsB [Alcaligenaceae bacterium CGII-47]